MTPSEIHNRDAPRIVDAIIKPMLDAGGDQFDVLVTLETVVAGVLLWATKEGSDEVVVNVMAESIKVRLAGMREARKARQEGHA